MGLIANSSAQGAGLPPVAAQQAATAALQQVDREKIYEWIVELASPNTRENALLELRQVFQRTEELT